jgi:hypothetical protein
MEIPEVLIALRKLPARLEALSEEEFNELVDKVDNVVLNKSQQVFVDWMDKALEGYKHGNK